MNNVKGVIKIIIKSRYNEFFLIIPHKFHLIELNSISLRLTNKINASSNAKET